MREGTIKNDIGHYGVDLKSLRAVMDIAKKGGMVWSWKVIEPLLDIIDDLKEVIDNLDQTLEGEGL